MLDGFFFVASKVFWTLLSPGSLIVLLGFAAWLCLVIGWIRLARRVLAVCVLLLVWIGFFPVGEWLIAPLENRFTTNAALPPEVDGIIVLGGPISPTLSEAWGQVEVGDSAERLIAARYLAGLYPEAELVFTGGSGELGQQALRAADYASYYFEQSGLAGRPVVYERDSRNTAENAANSLALVSPTSAEQWILVTSAFHMPRAVGVFCRLDWAVHPYPVDHYSTRGDLWRLEFEFTDNLREFRTALHEWLGLFAYRITGRSAYLLAGDNQRCGLDREL